MPSDPNRHFFRFHFCFIQEQGSFQRGNQICFCIIVCSAWLLCFYSGSAQMVSFTIDSSLNYCALRTPEGEWEDTTASNQGVFQQTQTSVELFISCLDKNLSWDVHWTLNVRMFIDVLSEERALRLLWPQPYNSPSSFISTEDYDKRLVWWEGWMLQ